MPRNNEEDIFSALAHQSRRDVLRYLRGRDYVRAGDIGEALGIGPSTLSGHLRSLRAAGLIESRRRGTEIQYRAQLSVVDEVILLLRGLRSPDGSASPDGSPSPDASPSPDERQIR